MKTAGVVSAEEAEMSSDGCQLLLSCPGWHHLIFPVFLLHHGRNQEGPRLSILQLDAARGQHYHLSTLYALREWNVVGARTKLLVAPLPHSWAMATTSGSQMHRPLAATESGSYSCPR